MNTRRFAMIAGTVMFLMGLMSLFPMFYQTVIESGIALPPLNVEASYGLAFSVFPMNIFNKIALILFGLAGIAAARETGVITNEGDALMGSNTWDATVTDPDKSSVFWSRAVFWFMGVLTILGIIPQTQTFFGMMPLFGAEVWAHAVFAALGGVFGYTNRARMGTGRRLPANVRPIRRAGAA